MKGRIVMLSALALLLLGVIVTGLASADSVIHVEDGQSGEVRANETAILVCNVNGSSYVWDFGDGHTVTTNLSTVTHVYEKEGDYTITVRVNGTEIAYTLKVVSTSSDGAMLALIGAGLAVGVAGMGTGIGSGIAGSAAAGATASHPEKFGKYFVFQTLPQTQAIYGLLVAILILIGTGALSGGGAVPIGAGLVAIGAGLAVGIAGLSAIGQGVAAAGAIGAYSEKDEVFGKGIVFSALPETQAIYGLLIAILLMVFSGLLGGGGKNDIFMGDNGIRLGLTAIGAGLAVGIAGMSAVGQGIAASSGIGAIGERPEMFGKGIVFSALPETQAIYGLLIAILLMVFSGLIGGGKTLDLGGDMGAIGMGLVGVGAGLAVGIAGMSAIGQGIAASSGIGVASRKPEMFGKGIVFSALPETQAIYGLLIAILLMVFGGMIGTPSSSFRGADALRLGLTAIGAGLAVGIAGLSAIGQGIAAGSGIGTTSEKPEMFGKSIVFSALPETQAIYGLLIAILLMVFSGLIGGGKTLGLEGVGLGIAAIGAGLAVGTAGLSAIGQGITAASGISATAKKPETFGRSMIFSVMSETPAIFALLIAILIMIGTGIMG